MGKSERSDGLTLGTTVYIHLHNFEYRLHQYRAINCMNFINHITTLGCSSTTTLQKLKRMARTSLACGNFHQILFSISCLGTGGQTSSCVLVVAPNPSVISVDYVTVFIQVAPNASFYLPTHNLYLSIYLSSLLGFQNLY